MKNFIPPLTRRAIALIFAVLPLRGETNDVEQLLLESRKALAASEAAKAVTLAEQAVAAAPARADVHVALGSALSQRINEVNFMQKALMSGRMLSAFEKAVELDPDHLPARIGLVRFYAHAPAIAGGSRAKAEAQAEQIQRRDAWLGALELSFVAEKFGDLPKALEQAEAAARLRPGHPRAMLRVAALHEELGQAAAAREGYSRVLEIDPENKDARAALLRIAPPATE